MGNTGTTFSGLFGAIGNVLNATLPVLFVIATAVFLYGLILYLAAAGDEEKVAESKNYIIYGLIGLFVMLAMWGLVYAAANTLFG